MVPLSIAIIGAGPAGLTLARILQVHLGEIPENSLRITIFERDANMHEQTDQIGTLDLHEDTGMAAMKRAGLFDQFLQYARYDGEELVIAHRNGTELVHMKAGGPTTPGVEQSRPEIDREKLVKVLLESVGKENIEWNSKLERVTEGRRLIFKDGRVEGPYDLIVGADGTWSKVRPLLTDVRPTYSGICGFESWIVDPNERHPQISKFLGRGAHFAFGDNKGIMCHRLGNENIKVNFWLRQDQDFHSRVMEAVKGDEETLRSELQKLYSDWSPEYRQCIDLAERFKSRALWELPPGDEYKHREGFVLLGDAAVSSPSRKSKKQRD
jgi:2-polyprenyl-6-methoxyphenol hydroxylase-like FAD-dependent oxidoreductase